MKEVITELARFGDFPHLAKMARNQLKRNDRNQPHLAALYLAIPSQLLF